SVLPPLTDIDEVTGDCRCRGHLRADEMRAPTGALPPFEVTVRRRSATLTRKQDVRVHPEAHRAAGVAPFEPGVGEDRVEPLFFSLCFDKPGARHDHCPHSARYFATAHNRRGRTQILDSRV